MVARDNQLVPSRSLVNTGKSGLNNSCFVISNQFEELPHKRIFYIDLDWCVETTVLLQL